MKLVDKEYQIFNEEDSSQALAQQRQLYSLEKTLAFEKSFLNTTISTKIILITDYLLRVAIIVYVGIKQMSDPLSLGLGIISIAQTLLNVLINLYFMNEYGSTKFLGQNTLNKVLLNIFSQGLQFDTLFFVNQCKSNQIRDTEVSNFDYATLQWFYIKRISIAARIHLVLFCHFYLAKGVDIFAYLVFSLSLVLALYYNHLNSNILTSSSSSQKAQTFLPQLITNIETTLQLFQSFLFIIYVGSTSLAWVIVFLPTTTILFSFLSFIDSRLKFEPFTVGMLEYIFLGQNSCYLIPILKNDFAMAQVYLGGFLKMFFLVLSTVLQTSIQIIILTMSGEEMPEGCFQLQIVLVAVNTPIMLTKLIKISLHFFQQITIQTTAVRDINIEQLKNVQKVVVYYQNNQIFTGEDIKIFENLIKMNMRELYVQINNCFSIQSYHGHTKIIISSMKDIQNLQLLYISLLKHSKTLNLKITYNGKNYQKQLIQFFIFILKNLINPSESSLVFNKKQLVDYIIDNKRTKHIENMDQIFNFPRKTILEFIVFEQNLKNLLMNNHHQLYYDLFEDL